MSGTGGSTEGSPAPPTLSRGAVDRAAEHRGDDAWLKQAWATGGRLLVLGTDMRTPVRRNGSSATLALRAARGDLPEDALFLGRDDAAAYFAVVRNHPSDDEDSADHGGPGGQAEGGTEPAGLRDVGSLLDDRDAGLLVHAVALATWHQLHPRCPRCGQQTEVRQGGHVRHCPNDASEHYPRTDPAMIVLVTTPDGDKAVLARAANWRGRMISCLAGFVEPGESSEQCVLREVHEEVGLDVRDVRYASSQPWPFPSSLMLAYTAVADEAELCPDAAEIAEARWVTRAELRQGMKDGGLTVPPPVSVARRLIDDWLATG